MWKWICDNGDDDYGDNEADRVIVSVFNKFDFC